MIVAIDGTAGSGKSTTARLVAANLGYYFLNTGSFYRAYTLSALKAKLDMKNPDIILEEAKKHSITVQNGNIYLDGKDVENQLHTEEVDKYCSFVSNDPRLREMVTNRVREIAGKMDIVTEGRDTTTVIFPDADVKFYFDADISIRAERRASELKSENKEDVLKAIEKRDFNDKNKKVGALKLSPDVIYLDTSLLTIKQVYEIVINAVERASQVSK